MARNKAKYQKGDVVKLANDEGLDIAQESIRATGVITKVYDDNFSYDVYFDAHAFENAIDHVCEYHIDKKVGHLPPPSVAFQSKVYPYWH